MNQRLSATLCAVVLLTLPASAHHSFAAEYDLLRFEKRLQTDPTLRGK